MRRERSQRRITDALHLIADEYSPGYGRWAYRAFDEINGRFFGDRLPRPLIVWSITAYGRCLGTTLTVTTGRNVITLHPALVRPVAANPWGVQRSWLGPRFAFDILIHELVHVAQHALHPDARPGESSHNCASWCLEVNRLCPLLDLGHVQAGLSRPRRVPVPGATTKTGKPGTQVQRVDDGDIPLQYHARFPWGIREFLGTAAAYYSSPEPPYGLAFDGQP